MAMIVIEEDHYQLWPQERPGAEALKVVRAVQLCTWSSHNDPLTPRHGGRSRQGPLRVR
jgi:hypothetical protein